jgi:hypothetical protein
MAQEVGHPGLADPAGADVLVAVGPRAAFGLRVVEVDHRQAADADQLVEAGEHRVDRSGPGDVIAGAPRMGRVDAEPETVLRDAAPGRRLGDHRQLFDRRADPGSAARRVLEDEHRRLVRVGAVVALVEHAGDAPGDPRDPGLDAGAPV